MASDLIGAVGAGRMGRGIVLAMALAGRSTVLIDIKPRPAGAFDKLRGEALEDIARDLAFLVEVEALTAPAAEAALARIAVVSEKEAREAIGQCAFLFEGVPETVEAKRDCFAFVGPSLPAGCILASTTSTMDADTLSEFAPDPALFLDTHWLNPAHLMPLIEVSPSARTSPETLRRTLDLFRSIGKVPVTCKASPGFIVSRIQALAMNEAARLVEEGVATAEDIDLAVRVGFGTRFSVLGLLEFIDWGGGDILYHASNFLSKAVAPRFEAPAIINENMREGRRGLADGRGFYDFADVDIAAYRRERMRAFIGMLRVRDLMPRFAPEAVDPGM